MSNTRLNDWRDRYIGYTYEVIVVSEYKRLRKIRALSEEQAIEFAKARQKRVTGMKVKPKMDTNHYELCDVNIMSVRRIK